MTDNNDTSPFLTCDALPMQNTIELNLSQIFSTLSQKGDHRSQYSSSAFSYTGTSTISFQIEEPTNVLYFHCAQQKQHGGGGGGSGAAGGSAIISGGKVKIDSMKIFYSKKVLRPKHVFDLGQLMAMVDDDGVSRAGEITKRIKDWNLKNRTISLSPFPPAAVYDDDDNDQPEETEEQEEEKQTSIHLKNLPTTDFYLVELTTPLSYCVVDLVFDFTSCLSDDGKNNGIFLSSQNNSGGFMLATHFEVDHAHRCFPCVDFTFLRQHIKFILNGLPSNSPTVYCRSNGGDNTCEEDNNTSSTSNNNQITISTVGGAERKGKSSTAGSAGGGGGASNTNNNNSAKKVSLPPSSRPIPFYIAAFIVSTIPMMKMSQNITFPEIRQQQNQQQQQNENENDNNNIVPEEIIEISLLTLQPQDSSSSQSNFLTDVAFNAMTETIQELRPFFNCAIDVPHICLVAVPRLCLGGMENDCLIFINESIGTCSSASASTGVAVSASSSSSSGVGSGSGGGASSSSGGGATDTIKRTPQQVKAELTRFVVHEIAHHWIGNRIGFSFAWKEGITLVLERYFSNQLLGLPLNSGVKGVSSSSSSANDDSGGGGGVRGAAASSASARSTTTAGGAGGLVQVSQGQELSGETYQKAEAAMEAAVKKMGWTRFQTGMQKMFRMNSAGDVIPDKKIPKFFSKNEYY